MVRRLLLIVCVALFASCAAGWAVSYRRTVEVSTEIGPAISIVLHRGACMVYRHRVTTAPRGSRLVVVEPHGLVHGDAWDWMYFPGRIAGFSYFNDGYLFFAVRFPLALPSLGCVLVAFWLWRRHGRRNTGKGFEVRSAHSEEQGT